LEYYIDPEWLEAVRGTRFFYPASGRDIEQPFQALRSHIDEFTFCDIRYVFRESDEPTLDAVPGCKRVGCKITGTDIPQFRNMYHFYEACRDSEMFHAKPLRGIERYAAGGKRRKTITRICDFGEIAIDREFEDRSLGIFMHRGDSRGEGGSDVWFLGRIEPSLIGFKARLFERVLAKLRNRALIITDGSNSTLDLLVNDRYHRPQGGWRPEHLRGMGGYAGGFEWQMVGWLPPRYGETRVWGVTRVSEYRSVGNIWSGYAGDDLSPEIKAFRRLLGDRI